MAAGLQCQPGRIQVRQFGRDPGLRPGRLRVLALLFHRVERLPREELLLARLTDTTVHVGLLGEHCFQEVGSRAPGSPERPLSASLFEECSEQLVIEKGHSPHVVDVFLRAVAKLDAYKGG